MNNEAEARIAEVLPPKPKRPDLVAGARVIPIVPRTIDEVARVAQAVIVAGLAPNSYEGANRDETISKIMIGIMKGAEVGLPPITALSTIAIINRRPVIWGDGAQALIQDSGQLERMVVTELGAAPGNSETGKFADDYGFMVEMYRRGQTEPYVGKFTVADARRAHLWMNVKKTPWIEHPKRMLLARARAFAQRDGFADCLAGLSIREEVEDLPPEAPAKTNTDFLEDATEMLPAPEEEHPAEPITEGTP